MKMIAFFIKETEMKTEKWINNNTESLKGKRVAMTGSTGGIGKELSDYLANLGAELILLDRNEKRSLENKERLMMKYPDASVSCITLDLEDIEKVKSVTEKLLDMDIDIFVHNAGAYSIPRKICTSGYDNVFQINFVSPYYMIRTLLPLLSKKEGRVIVVGSIAHNYSHIDENDVDFRKREASSKVYGNAKRYLMYSLYELFENECHAHLSVTHPGITFTNITAHYPKLIFAIIKHPMKVIFMKPGTAALSILKGFFEDTDYHEWIGPRLFDVWGLPKKKKLKTVSEKESKKIAEISDNIYNSIK